MKIEDYPLATSLSDTDLLVLETANGTKKVDIGTLSSLMKASVNYQPGDLYFSYDPTSPAEKFGGSWVQLTDVYLRAADNIATGGSDTVTLTVAQMPSHNHYSTKERISANLGSGTTATAPSAVYSNNPDVKPMTSFVGDNEPHSVMPSYQNIYVWRRIED